MSYLLDMTNEETWWWKVYATRCWGGEPNDDYTAYKAIEGIVAEATRRGEEGKSYKARAITKLAGMRCRCSCQRNNVIDEIIDVLKTL